MGNTEETYLYIQGSCMPHYGSHGKLCYGGPAAFLHGCRSKSNQAPLSFWLITQHDSQSCRILLTDLFEAVWI
jgi:hypothetical protein